MSLGKRCCAFTSAPPPDATTPARALPSDLVLEIVARSDAATLVRCAACCKPLRRDILSPAFIRRVCHGPGAAVPPRLLCFLQSRDMIFSSAESRASPPPVPFSLAHPATPAAVHLSENHLAPFVSRGGAADLLNRYEPVTSCGGLVMLRRHSTTDTPQELGICVYDPMTGDRTFLPDPPEMENYTAYDYFCAYVLLTASDGIGCSFLLLAADFSTLMYPENFIKVRTVSSPGAAGGGSSKWSPVTTAATHHRSHCSSLHPYSSAVVLGDSIIHWVMNNGRILHILTYDVRTATAGSIELPMDRLPESYRERGGDPYRIRLSSSPDGRLTVLVRDRLTISVWLLSGGGAGWARHAEIDTEEMLRSLVPELPQSLWPGNTILFESSGERSGVVLFYLVEDVDDGGLIALDIETKEMHRVNSQEHIRAFPFEVDLESRLAAMKTF